MRTCWVAHEPWGISAAESQPPSWSSPCVHVGMFARFHSSAFRKSRSIFAPSSPCSRTKRSSCTLSSDSSSGSPGGGSSRSRLRASSTVAISSCEPIAAAETARFRPFSGREPFGHWSETYLARSRFRRRDSPADSRSPSATRRRTTARPAIHGEFTRTSSSIAPPSAQQPSTESSAAHPRRLKPTRHQPGSPAPPRAPLTLPPSHETPFRVGDDGGVPCGVGDVPPPRRERSGRRGGGGGVWKQHSHREGSGAGSSAGRRACVITNFLVDSLSLVEPFFGVRNMVAQIRHRYQRLCAARSVRIR